MALIRSSLKTAPSALKFMTRSFYSGNPVKSVLISQTNDVYTNLALEQWLSRNLNLSKSHVMLYYKNQPCIILGNSGNPWLDTNTNIIKYGDQNKVIPVARSQTAGKAAYQDEGVINLTFFTPQDQDKDYNKSVISRGLFRKFGLNVKMGDKTVYNIKVCENGSDNDNGDSYQNCSLFLNLNKTHYSSAIEKNSAEMLDMSFKQHHLNINDINPNVTSDGILSAIGWEFLRTSPYSMKDGGKVQAEKQSGFQMVNPTEKWFPGITEIREKLLSWEWCYGKTPKFSIRQSYPVPIQYLNSSVNKYEELHIKLEITDGNVENVSLQLPPSLSPSLLLTQINALSSLKGQKFSNETLKMVKSTIENKQEKLYNKNIRLAACA